MVPVRIARNSWGSRPHFASQGEHFAENFQCGGAHGVAGELDQVRGRGRAAHYKCLLAQRVEDRTAALDIVRRTGCDDEQLTGLGGIRVSEDRRCYVALPISCMLARQIRRSRGADSAHRQMDGTRDQALGKPVGAEIRAAEYDLANRSIIRQHADHEFTVIHLGDVRRRLEAERRELSHLLGATDVGDHLTAGGCQICGHRGAHVTEADKPNMALQRRTPVHRGVCCLPVNHRTGRPGGDEG